MIQIQSDNVVLSSRHRYEKKNRKQCNGSTSSSSTMTMLFPFFLLRCLFVMLLIVSSTSTSTSTSTLSTTDTAKNLNKREGSSSSFTSSFTSSLRGQRRIQGKQQQQQQQQQLQEQEQQEEVKVNANEQHIEQEYDDFPKVYTVTFPKPSSLLKQSIENEKKDSNDTTKDNWNWVTWVHGTSIRLDLLQVKCHQPISSSASSIISSSSSSSSTFKTLNTTTTAKVDCQAFILIHSTRDLDELIQSLPQEQQVQQQQQQQQQSSTSAPTASSAQAAGARAARTTSTTKTADSSIISANDYSLRYDIETTMELTRHVRQRHLNQIIEKDEDAMQQEQQQKEHHQQQPPARTLTNQRQEQNQNRRKGQEREYSTIDGLGCYTDLPGMYSWMVDFAANAPDHLDISLTDIGDSFWKQQNPNSTTSVIDFETGQERAMPIGHDILALKITGKTSRENDDGTSSSSFNGDISKSSLLLLTGVHPREYAPPELIRQWIIQKVIDPDNVDMQVILQSTEIHWIPYVNPDGRILAETTQPYRRKNLNDLGPGGSRYCYADEYGVDINRNFPFRYGLTSGSTGHPCSQTYRGAGAASEPETQAVVGYASSIFPTSQRKEVDDFSSSNPVPYDEDTTSGIFLDIHSYGSYYIFPWGHADQQTPNHEGLAAMAYKFAHFSEYAVTGPSIDFSLPASGATDDWAYGTLGTASMTWEVGTTFHQDCTYFENFILDENLSTLTYASKLTSLPYHLSKGPDIIEMTMTSMTPDTTTTVTTRSTSTSTITSTNNTMITVHVYDEIALTIIASDSDFSSNDRLSTTKQKISEIMIHVNVHPYHTNDDDNDGSVSSTTTTTSSEHGQQENIFAAASPTWTLTRSNGLLDDKYGIGIITWTVDDGTELFGIGRHTLYIQAKDEDGYTGPITAIGLNVIASPTTIITTDIPSPSPTRIPTSTLPTMTTTMTTTEPSSEQISSTKPTTVSTEVETTNTDINTDTNVPSTAPSPSTTTTTTMKSILPTPCIETDFSLCTYVSPGDNNGIDVIEVKSSAATTTTGIFVFWHSIANLYASSSSFFLLLSISILPTIVLIL